MTDSGKSKAQLQKEIEVLRRRVSQLETSLRLREASGQRFAGGVRTSSQLPSGVVDTESGIATTEVAAADVLLLIEKDLQTDFQGMIAESGHRIKTLNTVDEMQVASGDFDLAILDGRPDYSPFVVRHCADLMQGKIPGLHIKRMILVDYAAADWGYANAYSCHCSNYLQLLMRGGEPINEATRIALRKCLRETLSMPPYQCVNYYETITDRMLHTIVESSQAPMLVLDTQRNVFFANLVAQAWFRRPTQLLKGMPFIELVATTEHQMLFQRFLEHIQTMMGGTIELPFLARDGRRFDALLSAYRIFSSSFPEDSIGLTLHDITERKRAEHALQQSEEEEREFQQRLAALVEVSNELSLAEGERDLCRLTVELGCRYLGFPRLGLWLIDEDPDYLRGAYGTGEDGNTRDENAMRVPLCKDHLEGLVHLQPGAVRFERNVPLQNHLCEIVGNGDRAIAAIWDGTRILGFLIMDTLGTDAPLTERDGELLSLYASSVGSLYSRCQAEEELRRWEEQTRAIVKELNGFLWTATSVPGSPWRMQFPSDESFERITGYSIEELRRASERTINHIVLEEDEEKKDEMGRKAHRGELNEYYHEYRIRHANGSVRWIAESVRVAGRSDTEVRFMGICLDITDRKHLEEQLIQAQKMEAIGQLAGGVAHDFNNILTGIMGNIALAQFETNREIVKSLLEEAEKASARAASLVKQLLAFGRKSPIVRKPLDLRDVIREVETMVRNTFDRRIEIIVSAPPLIRPVLADASQMHQVLLNLLVNARDAVEARKDAGASPPRIEIFTENIDVSQREARMDFEVTPGSYVRLTVRDNGVGMDEKTSARIFEPFFTTKGLGKGTGLGLATVYGIVRQHNGWVTVSSEVDNGTTFNIYLPTSREEELGGAAPEQTHAIPTGTETVLVVEDEEIVRSLATSLLRRLGYQVLAAEDGREGLSVFMENRERIDLSILDISMPHLSGLEVLNAIREQDPNARVLLSSGFAPDGDSDQEVIRSADGFVSKPYRLQELAAAVRAALDPPAGKPVRDTT